MKTVSLKKPISHWSGSGVGMGMGMAIVVFISHFLYTEHHCLICRLSMVAGINAALCLVFWVLFDPPQRNAGEIDKKWIRPELWQSAWTTSVCLFAGTCLLEDLVGTQSGTDSILGPNDSSLESVQPTNRQTLPSIQATLYMFTLMMLACVTTWKVRPPTLPFRRVVQIGFGVFILSDYLARDPIIEKLEWESRSFEGILTAEPWPMLAIQREGLIPPSQETHTYLSMEWKNSEKPSPDFFGRRVYVEGRLLAQGRFLSLIGDAAGLLVLDDSIRPATSPRKQWMQAESRITGVYPISSNGNHCLNGHGNLFSAEPNEDAIWGILPTQGAYKGVFIPVQSKDGRSRLGSTQPRVRSIKGALYRMGDIPILESE